MQTNTQTTLPIGKSTLLDVLAGQLDSVDLKGSLLVNGSNVDKKSFRKTSGYVTHMHTVECMQHTYNNFHKN